MTYAVHARAAGRGWPREHMRGHTAAMILAREHLSAWALAMDQGCRSAEVPAGVRFVGREGGQLAVELKRDLSDADEAALFAGERVYAVAGGAPLVRWLLRGRWPAGLTTVALRKMPAEDLAALIDAPALGRMRALIVRDSPARRKVLARLLAGGLGSLDSLAIFDVTQATIDALAGLPFVAKLRTLRLIGPSGKYRPGQLAPLFGGDRRHLEVLDLEDLQIDDDACAALAGGDWSGLRHLRIDDCSAPDAGDTLVGASLGGLDQLHITRRDRNSPRSFGDAAIAAIVARSPGLRIASLAGSGAGDATAIALATHGACLEEVDLDRTRVGDAGATALGTTAALAGLRSLLLDATLGFDAAHALADSASPAVARAGRREHRAVHALRYWRPTPPQAGPPGPWPEPTLARRFRWQLHDDCETCGGTERCPDGWCPYHRETEVHPMAYGDRPPTPEACAWIAGLGDLVFAVERHAAALFSALVAWGRWCGEPRVTWWVLDAIHRGYTHGPFKAPESFHGMIAAVGSPELSDTGAWAHACARARARDFPDLPDPFTPARAIGELGVVILGLEDEDGLILRLGRDHT